MLLPLDLVTFKHLLLHLNKVKGLLIFTLLDEDFKVQFDEFLVDFKFWLFHQLQQEEIGNVQDFGLKSQTQTDQVHRFDSPLCIDIFLMDLVKIQTLILLL